MPFGFEVIEFVGVLGVLGVGALEAWWTHPEPPVHRASVTPSDGPNRRCPYCHEDFCLEDEQVALVSCGVCRTQHHAICWSGHGGCSVYACQGRALRELPRPLSPVAPVTPRQAEELLATGDQGREGGNVGGGAPREPGE
jgi:hypothetical protein